jgi:hypothetical protein
MPICLHRWMAHLHSWSTSISSCFRSYTQPVFPVYGLTCHHRTRKTATARIKRSTSRIHGSRLPASGASRFTESLLFDQPIQLCHSIQIHRPHKAPTVAHPAVCASAHTQEIVLLILSLFQELPDGSGHGAKLAVAESLPFRPSIDEQTGSAHRQNDCHA